MTVRRRHVAVGIAGLLLLAVPGCSAMPAARGETPLLVVVSAPVSTNPWLARATENGSRLAVDEATAAGGVRLGPTTRRVDLLVLDNAGSPSRAVDIARTAVERHALALVTDGVGVASIAPITQAAALPVFVTFDGGASLIDPGSRPGVFRVAPQNVVLARRLADYVASRTHGVALLTEDSQYGREGATALRAALARDGIAVRADRVLASGLDPGADVLRARGSGADTVIVWGSGSVLAASLAAARTSGWTVPFFTSPAGEDPIVRQQTAAHPEWTEGLTFASFRITAEVGPGPYLAFRAAYERRFGAERLGLTSGGRDIVQPPDWAMFPYDAVKLMLAAAKTAGGTGPALSRALSQTTITGANGDEYGFSPGGRESVSQSDIYLARFHDQRFDAVTDDPLGPNLPSVAQ